MPVEIPRRGMAEQLLPDVYALTDNGFDASSPVQLALFARVRARSEDGEEFCEKFLAMQGSFCQVLGARCQKRGRDDPPC